MITKDSIETAYSFLHQKQRIYVHSTLDWQKDDIEIAIASYADEMSQELLDAISGGRADFLRDHKRFQEDITKAALKKVFTNVGLVHGQMDKKSRDAVMAQFADDNSGMNILVATTVIEVGIDVPRATIIVIENAERFGLAALHQLRGRVGRGNTQSYCVLIYGDNISPDGLKRLNVLCETDDGFAIAEQDLMMRGVGELLGTKQSGWIQYHFVDYREHRDLFRLASRAARDGEPDTWTRDLMYIFDCGVNVGA